LEQFVQVQLTVIIVMAEMKFLDPDQEKQKVLLISPVPLNFSPLRKTWSMLPAMAGSPLA
jgi:hypothetical protein